jgi:hypothetical protein
LSLHYYGIVHKADMEDYMQNLREAPELNKNDFRQSAYSVKKKKKTEEVPIPQQSRRFVDQHRNSMMIFNRKSGILNLAIILLFVTMMWNLVSRTDS